MKNSNLRVGLVQCAMHKQPAHNLKRLGTAITSAATQGAQLIVLPELHNTPYFCQRQKREHFTLAEPIPGPTTDFLGALAKQINCVIVGSVFEQRAPGIYHNTAVVLDVDGEIAGIYRKMHIPDDPGFNEKYYFTPGEGPITPVKTSVGNLGVLVCWDQWYPEAARVMAVNGADMLIYPTAIGWDPDDGKEEQTKQLDAWQTIQRAHAIANGLPVISCNRIGLEADPDQQTAGIQFWGHSFICGAMGETLCQAGSKNDKILLTDIDLSASAKERQTWPFLRDRRIESYQDILLRYKDPS